METLQKFADKLEQERMNERQMRLKLEEEYAQNAKSHEEEVVLRLKFEKQLNKMHSDFRELTTKYERCYKDLQTADTKRDAFEKAYNLRLAECTEL